MIKSDSPREIAERVRAHARELRARPEVQRVIWFGSRVSGRPQPGSDVDLCVVVSASPAKRHRDRIPFYLPGAFPVGVDLFVLTEGEWEPLAASSPGLKAALDRGVEV